MTEIGQKAAVAKGLWRRARGLQVPLAKDFYKKARYPLDLGAAKPVKRRTKCI